MSATVHQFPGRPRPRLVLVNPDGCPPKPAGSTVPDPKRRVPAWEPVEGVVSLGEAADQAREKAAQRMRGKS